MTNEKPNRGASVSTSPTSSGEQEHDVHRAIREERRRIANLLHDGLQQELTLLVLLADTLAMRRAQGADDAALERKLLAHLKRLNDSVRKVVEELLPADAEDVDELLGSGPMESALTGKSVGRDRAERD